MRSIHPKPALKALFSRRPVRAFRDRLGLGYPWIMDDPVFEADTHADDETLEMRHWNGRPWSI
jgi:hypothetical protein